MNALELRRRTLGKGVYKKTIEGNPAIAQGSLARMYPGIEMQGWTEQNQYEGKNLFDISDFDLNNKAIIENGMIIFSQSLGSISYSLSLSPGTYCINFDRSNYSLIGVYVNEALVINNGGSGPINKTFTVNDGDSVVINFSEGRNPNAEIRTIYNIMLNSGSTALAYEPYTGGAPSPNPDYPQEIVSAGKYDEGTGKYQYTIKISDSEESPTKSQTVLLTSDRPLTKWDRLEKRNGVWGWVYKSAEIVLDGSEDENWKVTASSTYTFIININGAMFINSYCDRYICMPASWVSNNFGVYSDNGYDTKYFRPPSADVETVEQWKTFLSQNPLTVVCETAEETFVPLSESEQEAMNALHTFRPTTVLSNDAGCEMSLTYKTKKSLEVTD